MFNPNDTLTLHLYNNKDKIHVAIQASMVVIQVVLGAGGGGGGGKKQTPEITYRIMILLRAI